MNNFNLNKKQQLVYDVIQRTPEAADDDALLLERYWIEVDNWNESKSLYWNLQRATRPETISRRRRELFNMNLITYSDTSLKTRTEAYKAERDVHSGYEIVKAGIVSKKYMEITNEHGERVMVTQ